MKRSNRNRARMTMSPLKIVLSEDEIMADLKYPAANNRQVTAQPAETRNGKHTN